MDKTICALKPAKRMSEVNCKIYLLYSFHI